MKRKFNILISAVLILLILPMQFGCNKDKLLQETEEQAIVDANDDMPFPETDPFGNPFDPEAIVNTNGNKGDDEINITSLTLQGINYEGHGLNSWSHGCTNLSILSTGSTHGGYHYVYLYYERNGSNISSNWVRYNHIANHQFTRSKTWDVSFHEGDVVQPKIYVYFNGKYYYKAGSEYTISNPTPMSWFEELMVEALKYLPGAFVKGVSMPWTKVAKWGLPYFSNHMVIINVVDQDGNPLHANVKSAFGTKVTTLGSVQIKDTEIMSLGKNITVTCKEPDGPQSYDNNLMDRQKSFDVSEYFEGDYWGKSGGNIPVVTVVFNTNGTTTVDYPRAVDQEQLTYNCITRYSWTFQSFTPTLSTLTAFEFKSGAAAVSPSPIVHIQIRENSFTGNIIATSSNSETIGTTSNWVKFNIQGGVQLTPETEYFMTIVNENGRMFYLQQNWRNEYTRGKTNYPHNDCYDIMFRTYGY